MSENMNLDNIAISVQSHRLLDSLLDENPELKKIMEESGNETEVLERLKQWVFSAFKEREEALSYYRAKKADRSMFEQLAWQDYAIIRILDYIDYAGETYEDLNRRGEQVESDPFRMLWLAVQQGTGGAKPGFFEDMIQLFRQLRGDADRVVPGKEKLESWMDRYPSGLDPRIVQLRKENKHRILSILIQKISEGTVKSKSYTFPEGLSEEEKYAMAEEWWNDRKFHLRFAVRNPDLLNEMLGYSLDPDTMKLLKEAQSAGIPFFVNPYYLSLLNVREPRFAVGADLAIRHYVLYSKALVEEFGHIVAWEKEDLVEPGKPNAAGWILPSHHNVHRRYPEVAILIPDSVGRACGGLCSSCQRMYDFQRGNLNFNLDKLRPNEKWPDKLKRLLTYFEEDSQLRDILITGGDAFMSTDRTLENLLEEVYRMAVRKREANQSRPEGEKYAEIMRIRFGTRLPAYLPQRITPDLARVLRDFKEKASGIGIRQFVIQTHFESPMEITPETREAVRRLTDAGWIITNQLVFTAAASRRGHTAKLRRVLNDIGVLTYYTFTVKGYKENSHNFAPNARVVQEQLEEKVMGRIEKEHYPVLRTFADDAEHIQEKIDGLRSKAGLPFLATDRNVLNMPGVGKSLTFRVIGITRYGRRILEFDHDETRNHSPIIGKMGKVIIIESKSIPEYLQQLEEIGEDPTEYTGLYGFSMGQTEPRVPLYEYPQYKFGVTPDYTNLEV